MDSIHALERRRGLSTVIAKKLHDTLLSGPYKPGDRLPPQRALAQQFGTSMASIREAVSVLTALGLLEVHPGKGTTVARQVDAEWVFDGWLGLTEDSTAIRELIALRLLLESYAVAEAAKHIGDEGRQLLQSKLDDMQEAISSPEEYLQADFAFHRAIAEIAGNSVLARVLTSIRTPFKWQLHITNVRHVEEHGTLGVSFEAHRQLVDAIVRGDGDAARATVAQMVERAYAALEERES